MFKFLVGLILISTQINSLYGQCFTTTSNSNFQCNGLNTGFFSITADVACCNLDTFYYQLVSGGNVIAFQGPTTSNTSTFNNLSAGSYTIYVYQDTTDLDPLNAAWCTSGGASISQPSAINITTTQTNLLCYGASSGSIVLSVGGGTIGPFGHSCRGYQVNWSGPNGSFGGDPTCSCTTGNPSGCVLEIPTISSNISNSANRDTLSGLSAGTYTITVTDYNGCQKTIVRTITQPPPNNSNYYCLNHSM